MSQMILVEQDGGDFYLTDEAGEVTSFTYPKKQIKDWDTIGAQAARAWFVRLAISMDWCLFWTTF